MLFLTLGKQQASKRKLHPISSTLRQQPQQHQHQQHQHQRETPHSREEALSFAGFAIAIDSNSKRNSRSSIRTSRSSSSKHAKYTHLCSSIRIVHPGRRNAVRLQQTELERITQCFGSFRKAVGIHPRIILNNKQRSALILLLLLPRTVVRSSQRDSFYCWAWIASQSAPVEICFFLLYENNNDRNNNNNNNNNNSNSLHHQYHH